MKRNISIILNSLIVIFEIIGLITSYKIMNRIGMEYYTVDANIIALISSILYLFYIVSKKRIPTWVKEFKYISTIGLTITLSVVLFVLIPMEGFNFYSYLISDSFLYHHLLCPIIAIISFIFFDNLSKYNIKDSILGLNLTFIYSIVLIILNIYGKKSGPYPFLMVKNQSLLTSIIWFIILFSLAYLISFSLMKLNSRYNKE